MEKIRSYKFRMYRGFQKKWITVHMLLMRMCWAPVGRLYKTTVIYGEWKFVMSRSLFLIVKFTSLGRQFKFFLVISTFILKTISVINDYSFSYLPMILSSTVSPPHFIDDIFAFFTISTTSMSQSFDFSTLFELFQLFCDVLKNR